MRLQSIDPDGTIAQALPTASVLGAVAHVSARIVKPGVVQQVAGNGLIVGERDDATGGDDRGGL